MNLFFSSFDTPIGSLLSLYTKDYLLRIDHKKFYNPKLYSHAVHDDVGFRNYQKQLDDYFAGRLKQFTLDFYLDGTDFQKVVWQALLTIPYGETCTYKDLALKVDVPKGFRAVGNANGRNKLPIIIPCHRVLGCGGVGGYAWGTEAKKWLLERERNQ